MELLNKAKTGKQNRPIKVLQFGEGNFLRAFVDYMIDIANEQGKFNGDIVLVKPIEFGSLEHIKAQECQYTVQLRGIADGVIVLGLGCKNSNIDILKPYIGEYDADRVRFLVCQDVQDEMETGMIVLEELISYASGFRREKI